MKRREFLKYSTAASVPMMVGGFPVTAAGGNSILDLIASASLANGRVLVIIQMNGGNDGLNTIIPIDKYTHLNNARSNVLIPQSSILSLNGTATTGFHPALAEMRSMFNNGLINISQAVSYPNPNFSHFRSTDIWFTGSDANVNLNTGWIGRYLDSENPGFPIGFPNATMADPLSIQIGSQASIMTQGPGTNMSMSVTDPTSFYNLVNGIVDPAPATPYGHELTYLRLIKQQTNAYTNVVKTAFNNSGTLTSLYPTNNKLADQLKIVARMIKGGLKTPVYIVNHPESFDTHANQVTTNDKTQGTHTEHLKILSKAINAFQDDLKQMGVDDRVATMNFTEFGRRIKSNNSSGTDHGSATPIFVIGKNVNPIIIGTSPDIPLNAKVEDNIPMQHDFRSIYYTVLKDWFQLNAAQLNAVLFQPFIHLPIFNEKIVPSSLLSFKAVWNGNNAAILTWEVKDETNISSYDIMQSEDGVAFIKKGAIAAVNLVGLHEYTFTDSSLTKNTYYYKLQINERNGIPKFSEIAVIKKSVNRQSFQFKVLPNPFSSFFTISFENKITGLVTARLIDTGGKEMWKSQTPANDTFNLYFNINGKIIAAGIYTLQLIVNNEEGVVKVVKK